MKNWKTVLAAFITAMLASCGAAAPATAQTTVIVAATLMENETYPDPIFVAVLMGLCVFSIGFVAATESIDLYKRRKSTTK